jgi:hypothetical protein
MTLAWWILPLLLAAGSEEPIRDPRAPGDQAIVERGLVTLRLDPKREAAPGECDDLSAAELVVSIGATRVPVTSVERVPRPERHWLLLDISESAEARRREAKRSAAEYARQVMTPGIDAAALLTVDEDTLLVAGPDTDPEALARRIEAVPAGGSSALRDGLDLVLRQVEGDRHEQLILYWTDGQDNTSLGRAEDLLETLRRAPNATIFPIALMPTKVLRPGETPIGAFLFDVAKRSGGEVFMSSDERWLDQVRGWIARRFAVAFNPPPHASGRLALAVAGKRCQITVLPDPFARPDAVAGQAAPLPGAWTRLHAKQRKFTDDPACMTASDVAPWEWPLLTGRDQLAGCMMDVLSPPGDLFGRRPDWKSLLQGSVRVGTRDVRVRTPQLARLPRSLVEAIEMLVPADGAETDARSPYVIEGAALLAQRARIASSLFASRADYRDFALARLDRMAREDLAAIERDFREAFPELSEAQVADVAKASRAGRRVLEATRTPTDADLARVLAAWLGDIPAQDLLREWERRLVNRRLAGSASEEGPRWKRLRDTWAMPQVFRVAAPLILVRDPERDIVGFWRVVLPRPEWFAERAASRPVAERPEDRLPERPLALWLIDEIGKSGDVMARLSGYACSAIDYESMDPAWRSTPAHPYRRVRVALTFDGKEDVGAQHRAVVQAEFEVPPEAPVRLVDLASDVKGDAELDRALAEARGRLIEVVSRGADAARSLSPAPRHPRPVYASRIRIRRSPCAP